MSFATVAIDNKPYNGSVFIADSVKTREALITQLGKEAILRKIERAKLRVEETLLRTEEQNTWNGGFLKKNIPFTRALKTLPRTVFEIENKNKKDPHCKGATLAYYSPLNFIGSFLEIAKQKKVIILCRNILIQNEDILEQVILHEIFHAAGYMGESAASKLEIIALRFSTIKNGYWEKYQLERFIQNYQ